MNGGKSKKGQDSGVSWRIGAELSVGWSRNQHRDFDSPRVSHSGKTISQIWALQLLRRHGLTTCLGRLFAVWCVLCTLRARSAVHLRLPSPSRALAQPLNSTQAPNADIHSTRRARVCGILDSSHGLPVKLSKCSLNIYSGAYY